VFPYVCVIGVAVGITGSADDAFDVAARRAVARLRTKQLQRPTIDLDAPPGASALRPCKKDGTRPARETDMEAGAPIIVSASVKTRRAIGRDMRRKFLTRIFPNDPPRLKRDRFADSLHDLVASPPRGLPPALRNKMAVVHFDGNKFGTIRGQHPGQKAAAEFAAILKASRAALLKKLLLDFDADDRMAYRDREGVEKLRFELLMWGGDEATFVLPAWKVGGLLRLLEHDLRDDGERWKFRTSRLTHAVGILVCNYKMPIANARSLVEQMVVGAKNCVNDFSLTNPKTDKTEPDNALSLQVLESIEPQAGTVRAFRTIYYGVGDDRAFTLIGSDDIKHFLEAGANLTDPADGYPRSQLFGLLRRARALDPKRPRLDPGLIEDSVHRSAPTHLISGSPDAKRWVDGHVGRLNSGIFGVHPDAPVLGLMRLAEMWELFRPFADRQAGDGQ